MIQTGGASVQQVALARAPRARFPGTALPRLRRAHSDPHGVSRRVERGERFPRLGALRKQRSAHRERLTVQNLQRVLEGGDLLLAALHGVLAVAAGLEALLALRLAVRVQGLQGLGRVLLRLLGFEARVLVPAQLHGEAVHLLLHRGRGLLPGRRHRLELRLELPRALLLRREQALQALLGLLDLLQGSLSRGLLAGLRRRGLQEGPGLLRDAEQVAHEGLRLQHHLLRELVVLAARRGALRREAGHGHGVLLALGLLRHGLLRRVRAALAVLLQRRVELDRRLLHVHLLLVQRFLLRELLLHLPADGLHVHVLVALRAQRVHQGPDPQLHVREGVVGARRLLRRGERRGDARQRLGLQQHTRRHVLLVDLEEGDGEVQRRGGALHEGREDVRLERLRSPGERALHLRPELGLRAQGGLARLAELLVRSQSRGRLALRALEAGLLRFRVAAARHEARDVALQRQQLLVQLVQALLVRPDLLVEALAELLQLVPDLVQARLEVRTALRDLGLRLLQLQEGGRALARERRVELAQAAQRARRSQGHVLLLREGLLELRLALLHGLLLLRVLIARLLERILFRGHHVLDLGEFELFLLDRLIDGRELGFRLLCRGSQHLQGLGEGRLASSAGVRLR